MEIIGGSYFDVLDRVHSAGGRIDIKDTIRGFWDEMAKLLHDYAELSFNPDPLKTLQIGTMYVRGDQVNSPAASLILEDRLAQIEQAQSTLLDIFSRQIKLAERADSMFG